MVPDIALQIMALCIGLFLAAAAIYSIRLYLEI